MNVVISDITCGHFVTVKVYRISILMIDFIPKRLNSFFAKLSFKIQSTKTQTALCESCSKPIKQNTGRKVKRFCSDACRNTWWNKHTQLVKRQANYECTCLNCKNSFISYGNKTRKYCCHACYIEHRFGGEHHANQ